MQESKQIFRHVKKTRPQIYIDIQNIIRPHSIHSLRYQFSKHLKACVQDLSIFNDFFNDDKLARLLYLYAKHSRKNFPAPGEAFGIQITCRVTKSDTQGMLDSKHLKHNTYDSDIEYNVDKNILNCLTMFTNTTQIFEKNKRGEYVFVVLKSDDVELAFKKLPKMLCFLKRGLPYNKGINSDGKIVFLNTFKFIYVSDGNGSRILYRVVSDLFILLKRFEDIESISDVRYVNEKCGIVNYFFNYVYIIRKQYLKPDDKDILTILKYQCRSGKPLALNRDGLAKQTDKTPIEVLSFEAPKKNLSIYCTQIKKETKVIASTDKIFFGQQFNEGTGYDGFAIKNKN